jgi:FkbM family methyltransferase
MAAIAENGRDQLKKTLKAVIKKLIDASVVLMGGSAAGRYLFGRITANAMGLTRTIEHRGVSLTFAAPNELARARADTFSIKEPETLEWIDSIPEGSLVWDIGANVGVYTCYAAKARRCRVFAFEPSIFNVELLARNVVLNGLADKVTVVPLPLSETSAVSRLNMSSTDWGGAMSTFGEEYGHDGRALQKVFEYPTIGVSMSDAVELLKIPRPDYIKMDVDGIEHLILRGGLSVLREVKGILIEINDEFAAQAGGADASLREAGLVLKEKRHADIRKTGGSATTFNQIWVR